MKKLFILISLTLLMVTNVPLEVSASNKNTSNQEKEIVVYTGKSNGKVKALGADINVKESNKDSGIYVVPESELLKIKEKKQRGEIESWAYNTKFQVSSTMPDDTYYSSQWALPKIDAPEAWDLETGSSDVTLAIIDTGFKLDHPDLDGRFYVNSDEYGSGKESNGFDDDGNGYIDDYQGWDFISDDNSPTINAGGGTRYYHGTTVAGVAAANTNNNTGVAGLDWGVEIMPLKVMDNNGSGYLSDIALAIEYAADNGADVINLSLGCNPDPASGDYYCEVAGMALMEDLVSYAFNAGSVVVAASGNDYQLGVSYPAACEDAIAVGATNSSDIRASFSNYGPELDVVAPGVGLYTTDVTWDNGSGTYLDDYATSSTGTVSGTSYASPYVAALASLLLANDDYSPSEVMGLIKGNADKVAGMGGEDFTNYYGYGRINAFSSLTSFDIHNISTTSVSFSLGSTKIAGQKISANFTLTNNHSNSVSFERLKIDVRGNGDAQDIIGGSNIVLDAGETVDFSNYYNARFLTDNGSYAAAVKAKIGGKWYSLGSKKYLTIRNPRTSDFEIVTNIYMSPDSIGVRKESRGRYYIKNKTGSEMYISRAKINVRSSRYNQDINGYYRFIINDQDTYYFSQKRNFYYRDYYKCTMAIQIFGRWLTFSPYDTLRVR